MIKKNNSVIKRLKKMASDNIQILNIDYGPYQTTILNFKCNANNGVEAAKKLTQYFLGSGKADAAKFIEVSRMVFEELFSDDAEIKADGGRIFTNTNGLTLDKLTETMPASEIANIVTPDFYFVNMFGDGDYIEYDNDEGYWYLTP